MNTRAYLDWNATAPLRAEARAAMLDVLDVRGNPSSVHAEGRAARQIVERARRQVAEFGGADPADVIFTSSATEANMLALSPLWASANGALKGRSFARLLVSAVEHPSVLAGGRFAAGSVNTLPVGVDGRLDLEALRKALVGSPALVSVMLANNETGILQPVSEIADLVHEAGGLLHVDAVQAPGRIACNIKDLKADLLTLSAHKLGGPKGAGALIARAGLHLADPLIRGGGQERGLRAGTENIAGIAGFGAAAAAIAASREAEARHMSRLQAKLEAGLRAITPDVLIAGESGNRLPNTTCLMHRGLRAETAVIALDLAGVAVSSGAACSSGKVQPSHVLLAMGVSPGLAQGAIRISTGPATSVADIDLCLNAWTKVAESLLKGRTIAA